MRCDVFITVCKKLNETVLPRSGMLEQGVDRIVAQVVDPKINHIFRPQVERVVREFLSPGSCSEEPPAPPPLMEIKPDSSVLEQGIHIYYLNLVIMLSRYIKVHSCTINHTASTQKQHRCTQTTHNKMTKHSDINL